MGPTVMKTRCCNLLECELVRSGHNNTFFITCLLRVYQDPNWDDLYSTEKHNAWLCQLGWELATGILKKLVTIVNINHNHWVSIVIDAPSSRILYGDSFSEPIEHKIKVVLTWWTNHHTATDYQIYNLHISRQKDGYSCGMFAWNAVRPPRNLFTDEQSSSRRREVENVSACCRAS